MKSQERFAHLSNEKNPEFWSNLNLQMIQQMNK